MNLLQPFPPRLPTVAAVLFRTVVRGWQTSPGHQQASVVPGGYAQFIAYPLDLCTDLLQFLTR